ncbi:MAG TPA: hypothetical protein VNS09_06345 [Solirubrobacter sp.]|nr:hypothetical protein [Solirubrobacter sp.]
MEPVISILITIAIVGVGLAISYWVIRGAVGAAIRDNAWAIRGEDPPPRIDPVTGRPEGE